MVPRVCALHAAGKTRVIRETRSFADVNEAIADVEAGEVPGPDRVHPAGLEVGATSRRDALPPRPSD